MQQKLINNSSKVEILQKRNQGRNFLNMHVKFVAGVSSAQELKIITDGSHSAE